MAIGGGTFTSQNKILPGTYINVMSAGKANSDISERGIAAAPFILSWGQEQTVFAVTADDFRQNCRKLFGYDTDAVQMLPLREIFRHAVKVYCYRLGTGTAAQNIYATAKYAGTRGNDITIRITADVDVSGYYDVETYLDGELVDTQLVAASSALTANDYVTFKSFTLEASATAGVPLSGGADCASVTGTHYQSFLSAIESYSFNTLCCPASDSNTVGLFATFTERLRDSVGAKFQLVAYQPSGADYEGIIGVWNTATFGGAANSALIYWVAGICASASVSQSLTGTGYDGELSVNTAYTQAQLESALTAGKFMFHDDNGTVCILDDINSLHTFTDSKGAAFRYNQTVRICDTVANDAALIFRTRYLGKVQNDASGRASLWNDVVKLIRRIESVRAVENFDENTVSVAAGVQRGSVVLTINALSIVNAMTKLYMSVLIS